ncbi:methyl-accepting chemotaxis protein [Phenylobacterium sp. J426]|uniref:methyl-accepting chemotaxis protein n=1 Tax=Phenylobacterium sp. J426 TaxID=2898439 RepID=UPI002150DE8E|nr:methyl-accepting chemotaxis protein [Phenylobacterium sp. J426]MCR5874528.1 methyl-accepting chemotaxis protein [Phenylobacterium sp. J426]
MQAAAAVQDRLEASRAAVVSMMEGITAALGDTRASSARAAALEDAGRRIDKLVDAISLIAVQTTMLAVSGAVEAARAGEAGLGFATVSGDIRSLARESAENADRVKDVVRALQAEIAAVRRDLDQAAAAGEAEVAKNAAVSERLAAISGDMESVRVGAEETLQALGAILKAAREVALGAQQIAAAAEEAGGAAVESAAAARQQARGAEDLAAAIEEIAELADALQAEG